MEHDPELTHFVPLPQGALDLAHDLHPLLLVGGVDVPEAGFASERLDVGDDALGVWERGFPIEMHAEDMATGACESQARGRAESRVCSEDQSPAGQLDG